MDIPGWGDGGDDEQVAQAIAAERETLTIECRLDPERLDGFLADDFHEIGTSGREYLRPGMAQRVAEFTEPDDSPISIERLRGLRVADGVVAIKYVSEGLTTRSARTSLWRRRSDGSWELFHHQGTALR